MDSCPECGFTYGVVPNSDVVLQLQANGEALVARLATGAPNLTVRPAEGVWSPLEYCCHVRDVLLMQRDRLFVALVEDEPSFKPMYRDHRVAFDGYDSQAPDAVAAELVLATAMMVRAISRLSPEQWERPLIYNFPTPTPRTVSWVTQHTLHELVHHLSDIDRQIQPV